MQDVLFEEWMKGRVWGMLGTGWATGTAWRHNLCLSVSYRHNFLVLIIVDIGLIMYTVASHLCG